jgi:hypothetical protein
MNPGHVQISLDDPGAPLLGGADFLMNTNAVSFGATTTSAHPAASQKLGDIEILQADLNNAFQLDEVGMGGGSGAAMEEIHLGEGGGGVHFDTMDNTGAKRSFDEMQDFNTMPAPPMHDAAPPPPERSTAEVVKLKLKYLTAFRKMERRGVQLSKRYVFEDDVDEMAAEFDVQSEEHEKKRSVQMQMSFLRAFVQGAEAVNRKVDWFDLKFDGLYDAVEEDSEEFEDIFEEIHAIYLAEGTGPIFRLACKLAMTASIVHVTNQRMATAMPHMDQVIAENPEFVNSWQAAAAKTMANNGETGLANMMGSVMRPPPAPTSAPQAPLTYNTNPNAAHQEALRPTMAPPSEEVKSLLSGIKTKDLKINLDADAQDGVSVYTDASGLTTDAAGVAAKKRTKRPKKNTVAIDTISSDL